MNSILLDLGFIQIHWYSVTMFLAILIGGGLAIKEAKKWKIPEEFMINLFFFMIPLAFIGARLYYVAFNWSYYSQNLLEIIKIWEGGLAIHGAIIVGVIWTAFYGKKYKVNLKRLFDILVVGLLIGQVIGRWGNFFNGEAYGPATTLGFLKSIFLPQFIIDGMYINGVYYQPTFLYESLWCLIGFVAILFIRKLPYIKLGQITSLYLAWYGLGRFFIEGLRTDSLMFMGIKVAQIVSLVMIVIGVIAFIKLNKGSKFDNQYNDEENTNEIVY